VNRDLRARAAEAILSRRFLWAVLAAALAARVAWAVVAGDVQRFSDSHSYVTIADNVLAGSGFLWGDQRIGRAPLYPLLVAATRATLFGREFLVLYLVQAILSTATIVIFAAAASRLLGPLAANITALMLTFDPFLIFHAGTVLSETLFIFFLALFFCGAVRAMEEPRAATGFLAGAAAGAAALTRPSILHFVPVAAAGLVLLARPRARAALSAAAVLAAAFLVLLPWAARNERVTGRWIWTTLGVGASLYDGLGPQADGSSDMSFLHGMPELEAMDEVERDDYLREKALAAARSDPARAARLAAVKAGRFWSPVPMSEQFGGGLYAAASAVTVVPAYLLAVAGIFSGALSRRNLFILMSAPVYFTLVHMAFVGSARYRTPVMPFVAMAAAAAVAAFLARALGAPPEVPSRDVKEGAQPGRPRAGAAG
jgi:4-amino-4-deoxy-L-arabinose transferase-like glycosyltransferase